MADMVDMVSLIDSARNLGGGGSGDTEPIHRFVVQIGFGLGLTAAVAVFLHFLKQSTIVAYILVGVMLRRVFEYVDVEPDLGVLDHFSHVGIILLLFMAGLEVDIPAFLVRWRVVCIVGLGQIVINTALGMLIGAVLFPSLLNGLFGLTYFGLCCTFSSTIVVLGFLNRKQQLESLHGQLCLGLLVLQDITAVMGLAILSAATTKGHWEECALEDNAFVNGTNDTLSTGGGGLRRLEGTDGDDDGEQSLGISLLLLVAWLFFFSLVQYASSRFLLLPLFRVLTSSGELLFLGTIGYALFSAGVADAVNFSAEIGAFLAGASMTILPYKLEIEDKVENLKNFGIVTFFVTLGIEMNFDIPAADYAAATVLAFIIVFCTMFIVVLLGYLVGMKARPTFMVGGIVNQISEFSLILASLSVERGIFCPNVLTILTIACVITIVISGIGHEYLDKIWDLLGKKSLQFVESHSKIEIANDGKDHFELEDHVVCFGINKLTYLLAAYAKRVLKKKHFLAVSINPDHIDALRNDPLIHVLFADMFDPDTWSHCRLEKASLVISAIEAGQEAELAMARYMREHGGKAFYITTTDNDEEAIELYRAGSDFVIHTEELAALKLKQLLSECSLNELEVIGKRCNERLGAHRKRELEQLEKHKNRALLGGLGNLHFAGQRAKTEQTFRPDLSPPRPSAKKCEHMPPTPDPFEHVTRKKSFASVSFSQYTIPTNRTKHNARARKRLARSPTHHRVTRAFVNIYSQESIRRSVSEPSSPPPSPLSLIEDGEEDEVRPLSPKPLALFTASCAEVKEEEEEEAPLPPATTPPASEKKKLCPELKKQKREQRFQGAVSEEKGLDVEDSVAGAKSVLEGPPVRRPDEPVALPPCGRTTPPVLPVE